MRLRQWSMELARRLRLRRGKAEAQWPRPPEGVWLNPSDMDFASYDTAPLALTWRTAAQDDTARWQKKARSKLRELLGLEFSFSPIAPAIPGADGSAGPFRRRTLYIQSAPQRHVPVTVVWDPQREHENKPVMLCLQGHTSGAHLSWGQALLPMDLQRLDNGGDYALQAVRHGHLALCIEQIAFGERREQGLKHRWDHPCIDASNRALLLGRTLVGDRIGDVVAAIDWLMTRPAGLPGFDPKRIRTMGNSAGGEVALFSAALDTRIEGAIASGCVGDWRKTSGRRKTCPDTIIPGILNWMEYSDVLALCAPRPLLVVSGIQDHIYPFALASACAEDARAAYAALDAAQFLYAVPGPAGHRFYPDIAWPSFLTLLAKAS